MGSLGRERAAEGQIDWKILWECAAMLFKRCLVNDGKVVVIDWSCSMSRGQGLAKMPQPCDNAVQQMKNETIKQDLGISRITFRSDMVNTLARRSAGTRPPEQEYASRCRKSKRPLIRCVVVFLKSVPLNRLRNLSVAEIVRIADGSPLVSKLHVFPAWTI